MITFKRFLDEDSKELTAFESRADGFGGDRAAAKVYLVKHAPGKTEEKMLWLPD